MNILLSLCLLAVTPRFDGPHPVLSHGRPIDVGKFGVPAMGDITGDGLKDLLVGEYDSGFIRCYPNVGTDPSPVFDTFYLFAASGRRVQVPHIS